MMLTIQLKDDYIKLGQALKAAGTVSSGVDAKFMIKEGHVKVNGETEYQRGKNFMTEIASNAAVRPSRL